MVTAKKPAPKKPATQKSVAQKTTAKSKTVAKSKAEPKLRVKTKTAKDIATAKGEPYVAILNVELDPNDIGNGAFELDWNDKFIANLVRAGYQQKPDEPDSDIVDRWFQEVCRNIIAENFEQWEANQPASERPRIISRTDIGGGRTEVS